MVHDAGHRGADVRWCAKSRPIPTPAGPPSATSARTAIGRLLTRAGRGPGAMVEAAAPGRGAGSHLAVRAARNDEGR